MLYKIIDEIYSRNILNAGRDYAEKFDKGGEDAALVIRMMKYKSVRMLLSEVYSIQKRIGKCEDITKMPEERKRELWNTAREWHKGTRDETHMVCKSIIAIGSLL